MIGPAPRELLAESVTEAMLFDDRRDILKYIRQSTEIIQAVPKRTTVTKRYVNILLLKAGDTGNGVIKIVTSKLLKRYAHHNWTQGRNDTKREPLTAALREAEDNGDEAEALRLRQALNGFIKETTSCQKVRKKKTQLLKTTRSLKIVPLKLLHLKIRFTPLTVQQPKTLKAKSIPTKIF